MFIDPSKREGDRVLNLEAIAGIWQSMLLGTIEKPRLFDRLLGRFGLVRSRRASDIIAAWSETYDQLVECRRQLSLYAHDGTNVWYVDAYPMQDDGSVHPDWEDSRGKPQSIKLRRKKK